MTAQPNHWAHGAEVVHKRHRGNQQSSKQNKPCGLPFASSSPEACNKHERYKPKTTSSDGRRIVAGSLVGPVDDPSGAQERGDRKTYRIAAQCKREKQSGGI